MKLDSTASGDQPDLAGILSLVERISASRPFKKSLRQRELLHYLVRRSLEDGATEVHEQEIGSAVFGRPGQYDTSSDNIVRVNTYELRKRLETFFSGEGAAEEWIIGLPKGGYSVSIVRRRASAVHAPARRARNWRWVWPAIAASSVLCSAVLFYQNSALRTAVLGPRVQPPLNLLWERMISAGRTTDVVVADSNLSLVQDLTGEEIPAANYFGVRPIWRSQGRAVDERDRRTLDLVMSRRYTSVSDIRIIQRLSVLCGLDSDRLRIHYARDYSPDNLKTSNLILLGSKRANPWVAFFEQQFSFAFQQDPDTTLSVIVDRTNPSGRFATRRNGDVIDAYGVVVFLPNLARTGNTLILAGGGMHATESAGDLVTDPRLFQQLLTALNLGSNEKLPYFEALVQTSVIGATMQQPKVVVARTLKISGH